jgi:hypothetical protein
MGTETCGFVVTPCKDVFFVMSLVERALHNVLWPKARAERLNPLHNPDVRTWLTPTIYLSPSNDSAQAGFRFNGEDQALNVYFRPDRDPEYRGRPTLSLRIRWSNDSEQIMRIVLEALACLGPTFLQLDDCGVWPSPTGYPRFSRSQARERKLLDAYAEARWLQQVEAGVLVDEPDAQPH